MNDDLTLFAPSPLLIESRHCLQWKSIYCSKAQVGNGQVDDKDVGRGSQLFTTVEKNQSKRVSVNVSLSDLYKGVVDWLAFRFSLHTYFHTHQLKFFPDGASNPLYPKADSFMSHGFIASIDIRAFKLACNPGEAG